MSDVTAQHPDFAGINALLSRAPGYSVAAKCLEVQAEAERRNPKLRQGGRVWLHEDAQPWFVGALGEIEVGKQLERLGPEWFVRHSVPIGAGTTDVDHLLIGPAGVFAMNTKHHRGHRIWVGDRVLRINTTNTTHLAAAISEARNVENRLRRKCGIGIKTVSVIVVVGASGIKDIRSPENRRPSVIPSRDLVRWLNSLPEQLSPSELGLVRLAAEEPDTWHVDPRAADTLRVMQRFERLRAAAQPIAVTRGATTASPGRPSRTRPTRARRGRSSRAGSLVKALLAFAAVGLFAAFLGPIMQLVATIITAVLSTVHPTLVAH
jgi:hypothetical protein